MPLQGKVIKPTKGNSIPTRCIFFDTESKLDDQGKIIQHHPFLAWANFVRLDKSLSIVVDKWQEFTDMVDLASFIDSCTIQKSRTYVFAHNMKYDFINTNMQNNLANLGWQSEFVYAKGITQIITLKRESRTLVFLSSTNLLPGSLRNLGDTIGLEKLDTDHQNAPFSEVSRYCRRDTEIVREAVLGYFRFIRENNLGNFKMTIGSQALEAWRHGLDEPEVWIHEDAEAIALERAAYFGGRTEAFWIGRPPSTDYVSLDINSMYPHVMRDNDYPVAFYDHHKNVPLKLVEKWLDKYALIVDAEVEVEEPAYAYRLHGKTTFPTGSYRAHLCTGEIRDAIDSGRIKYVYALNRYRKGNPFSGYVDHLYGLREEYKREGNTLYTKLTKLLLNSLYGKFGQKREDWKESAYPDPNHVERGYIIPHDGGKLIPYYVFMGVRYTYDGEGNGPRTLVAIAAHVTSYGRQMLWSLIKEAGRENVYYCDTDSLKGDISIAVRLQHRIDPYTLGYLKNEGETQDFIIRGVKDYKFGSDVHIKGIPKGLVPNPDGSYTVTIWPSLSYFLRRGDMSHYTNYKINKMLSREYTKGNVEASGSVVPYHFVNV